MQDTKNLLKKLKALSKVINKTDYEIKEEKELKERIEYRKRNRKLNDKQFKKAN